LRNKVNELINTPQPVQRTPEWYEMRNSMITASDWATVLGESPYSNKDKILLKKCGEDIFITSKAIDWGVKYEKVATMIYELRNNVQVIEFGVLRHPTISYLGASPDGITSDGVMLEIKCPSSRKITGIPPSYYWCQVQGQLEVCELDRCDFLECLIKEYDNENAMTDFLDESSRFQHMYTCSEPKKVFKSPPEPFTTSRIQQVASNELHYSPKETMTLCQKLYEAGYITYMRTDSKTYSGEFLSKVSQYIVSNYAAGEKYVGDICNTMTEKKDAGKKGTSDKKAVSQDAHESIRPTNIFLRELDAKVDAKEKRMYKLIWENTLESCMTAASFFQITATISAFDNGKFNYKSELVDFPGWKIVSKKHAEEITPTNST
jgi:putative phage-type endonuclease